MKNIFYFLLIFCTGVAVGHFVLTTELISSARDVLPKQIRAKEGLSEAKIEKMTYEHSVATKAEPSQALPKLNAKLQTTLDQLKELNFSELKKICQITEFEWRKKNIDSRFFTKHTLEEEDKEAEKIFGLLGPVLQKSSKWASEYSVLMDNQTVQMIMVLDIYDSESRNEALSPLETYKDPKNLCWVLVTEFEIENKKSTWSLSNCLTRFGEYEGAYYVYLNTYESTMVSKHFSYLAIPLPIEKQDLRVQYLVPGSEEWKFSSDIRWREISLEESKAIRGKFVYDAAD